VERLTVSIHKWSFSRWAAGRSGFPAAVYIKYASPQTLVRPCQAKKILIYELDTQQCLQKIVDGH